MDERLLSSLLEQSQVSNFDAENESTHRHRTRSYSNVITMQKEVSKLYRRNSNPSEDYFGTNHSSETLASSLAPSTPTPAVENDIFWRQTTPAFPVSPITKYQTHSSAPTAVLTSSPLSVSTSSISIQSFLKNLESPTMFSNLADTSMFENRSVSPIYKVPVTVNQSTFNFSKEPSLSPKRKREGSSWNDHVDSRERNYTCSHCFKSFLRTQDLKRHEVTHAKHVRPYNCSFCPSNFTRADALRRHQKNSRSCSALYSSRSI